MATTTLHIKNMVCPRCIEAVQDILKQHNLLVSHIELGKADIENDVSPELMKQLETILSERGFELLRDKNQKIIDHIKSIIIDVIHYHNQPLENYNFSKILTDKLNIEYKQLSSLFSSNEHVTIEKFIILQKIEKAKELISYHEKSVSEISNHLGYSSVHYLSNQFKKITGHTPSQFANMDDAERKTLDNISN